jgi:hypothetical protein
MVIRIALNRTSKWGYVERNDAALTDALRQVRSEPTPLTPKQSGVSHNAEGDSLGRWTSPRRSWDCNSEKG